MFRSRSSGGEVLGIIGRNGAGKSTLLKILSRVSTQSEGRITMRGRVGALIALEAAGVYIRILTRS